MKKEDYVSLEVAKLLKEKGYNEPCRTSILKNGELRVHDRKLSMDDLMRNNIYGGLIMAKETVHRYSLQTDANAWLGDVILTDDKKFYSITDWGNFNFGWTVSGDIRKFILTLDEDYFARKMFQGVSYQCSSKTMQACCKRFASRILPKLKEAIKKELEEEEKV